MRFVCWICTVAQKDKTMETMSKSGNRNIAKMLEFREWMIGESKKPENRYIRKNGIKGRLNKKFRKLVLKKVLQLQKEIGIQLISYPEIKLGTEILKSGKYGEYY